MKRLVIDLGHGGTDPGAIGPNKSHEADIVLAIGKELDKLLSCLNLDVKFTRLSNRHLSLNERCVIANNFKADYFLSIHINSANDKSVRGVEVWQYSTSDSKLNTFCSGLCGDISSIFKIKNRGVKINKDFYVLRNTNMPACLLEVDFISNALAEKDLNSSENIKKVALAIKNNLVKLFDIRAVDDDIFYKVCIGAYRDKNNALNQVILAKDKGFNDAYII